ncbi:MAG: hypothetical protein RL260_1712 [Pseudomonadota bacterium]|jgi:hypothetical protein
MREPRTPEHTAVLVRQLAVEHAIEQLVQAAEVEQEESHAAHMSAHYRRALGELFSHRAALRLLAVRHEAIGR